MTHFHVMTVHFNNDDYPYDYELEIWKNAGSGICLFYIREEDATIHFDQFLTVGQTLRWIHTGKADTNYTWHVIDFYSGSESQKKNLLDMRWEELVDSGVTLPLSLSVTFAGHRNVEITEFGFVSRKIGCSV